MSLLLFQGLVDGFDGILPSRFGSLAELVQRTSRGWRNAFALEVFLQSGDLAIQVIDQRVMDCGDVIANLFHVYLRFLRFLGLAGLPFNEVEILDANAVQDLCQGVRD